MSSKKILFVASEASPLVKVGGLADVVGALPGALKPFGVDARVIIPKYGTIAENQLPNLREVCKSDVRWQGRRVNFTILESILPGTETVLYLVDAPEFFKDGGVYYEHDSEHGSRLSMERFVFFSWAVSNVISKLPWQPDVVHCHDWHAAAIPVFLKVVGIRLPTILTIHNIEGQGKWSAKEVLTWVGLHGDETPDLAWRDNQKNINLLQLGIRSASAVNTVSPMYAHELLTSQYGAGLEKDLGERAGGITGILNGIDVQRFNPATDSAIYARYDNSTAAIGKVTNKNALLADLGLRRGHGPLFAVVGRLTGQKGLDLLPPSIPDIAQADGRLVVLGSGVPEVEQAVVSATAKSPDTCRTIVKFDARLAQRIYAAADFFLMPSRFEPCGLGQLLALRYGALPIVRDTGGLHDTVRDMRKYRDGTGLVFQAATPAALRFSIQDALRIFNQTDTMKAARLRAMNQDFSWSRSAQEYINLYDHAK